MTGRVGRRSRRLRFLTVVGVLSVLASIPLVPASRPTAAAAAADPVIAAVGDIACDPASSGFNGGNGFPTDCRQKVTGALLSPTGAIGPVDAVLPLGDEQYQCGGLAAFQQAYHPSWGFLNPSVHPVPGNHEYQTTGGTGCGSQHNAAGYFTYFGASAGDPTRGYYSYTIGSWHIIALNSELCWDQTAYDSGVLGTPGCGRGSPEETWLRNDLAASAGSCRLAYWHEPRFSSSPGKGDDTVDALWQALVAAKADVVLTGHQHWYERFAQMNGSGAADPNGVRQFIVGTGGESFARLSTRLPSSQASNDSTFGVLKLTLHPGSYDWKFVPVAGSTFTDSGTTACHTPPPADTTSPSTAISCNGAPCSGNWYGTNPVSVGLAGTDSGSGIARTVYTTDGSDPTTSATATTYAGAFALSTSATVRYASVDRAGNLETVRSQSVSVDLIPPVTAVECNAAPCAASYPGPVTVSLRATDSGGSAVATMRYTTDGTDPTTSPTGSTYASPFSLSSTAVVRYSSTDGAGNVEAPGSRPVTIGPGSDDTAPPTTSVACDAAACTDSWYGPAPVRVTLSATDAGGSGVAAIRYTTDGTDPASSSTAVLYSGPVDLASTTAIRFSSTDQAGNVEPTQSQLVRVDTTAPTTTASCAGAPCSSGWYRTGPVTVSLSATDGGGSGVVATAYTTDGSDPTTSPAAVPYSGPFAVSATATVRFSSRDAVGNQGAVRSQPVQIDTTSPTTPIWCNADPCNGTTYAAPVTVTLRPSDAGGSGLATTRYTTDGTDPVTSVTAKTYSGPFALSATTTVRASSTDNAGNVESPGTQPISVTGGASSSTLVPTDDSYTARGNASATHGSEGSINVNSGTSERRAYVKFTVSSVPAGATGVTALLKLYSQSSAASTVTVSASSVATTWNEGTLSWGNQPPLGPVVTAKAGLVSGAYNVFDVSGLVTGNGTYALVVTDNNTTQRYFSAKESAPSRPPQLVLSWTNP